MFETSEAPILAPLPPGAILIHTTRPNLPALYQIQVYSKVLDLGPDGRIIMAVYDWHLPAMQTMYEEASNQSPPLNEKERVDRGECSFPPSGLVAHLIHFDRLSRSRSIQ